MPSNSSPSAPLRILVNECADVDFHLLEAGLRRAGFACELRRTGAREEFARELEVFRPDLVVSDYHLPGFDGLPTPELATHCAAMVPPPPFVFLMPAAAGENPRRDAEDPVSELEKRLPGIIPAILSVMSRQRAQAECLRQACMPGELLRLTHDLIAVTTRDGVIRASNPAWAGILGYTQAELVVRPLRSLVHPGDMAIFDKWWREVLHSGTPADADADAPAADDADDTDTATVANAAPAANTAAPAAAPAPVLPACECRFIPKDGHEEPRHLLWRALVFPGLAHVVYIHGIDLTERRQAERALLESETRFRRIADSAPVLIWMADASCRFFYFSNRWLEFTGRGLDREIGHGCFENLHPDDREAAVRRFQAHYVGRTAFRSEFRLRRHDGVYRRFVDHATPCVDAQGEFSGFVGSCLDVTEQHEIEALITRRALKQSVLASFNHFALALHSFDELARRAVKLILDTLHVDGSCVFMLNPGDQRLLLRYCAGRESGIPPGDFGRATGAMLARRQAIRLSDDPENFPAAAALASLDMRSGIASPVGAPPRIHAFVVAFSRSPRVFSNEAVDFIQGIANVLSTVHHREHVEAALAESEQKLLQSQKLEIAGLIASGVAHDFNNLLTAIRGYGELLKDKLPDSSTGILAPIDGLLKTTSRATNLVRRLLAFARKHPPAPGPIDLNTLVTDLHDLIASFLPPGIRCELKLHPRPVTLVADRNQLEQVLINFAINARDAMPAGGTLTIRTAIRELAPGEIPSLRPGAHAVLSVQDTGTGMTDEVKAKIFDPFFTTKPPGSGTGLGLPVCLNVIRHFHGELLLETAPGRGSTFQVLLPGDPAAADPAGGRAAAPEMPDARPAPPPDPDAAGNDPAADGGELIYLVEDDDDIREITSAILKSLGYRVRAFATAKAILAYIAKKKGADAPDLLISDIFISDMDGRKLGRHIGKIHPALPALFMSGHVDSPAQLDDAHFMAKPFTRDILARKVRQALNAPRAQE